MQFVIITGLVFGGAIGFNVYAGVDTLVHEAGVAGYFAVAASLVGYALGVLVASSMMK